MTDREVMQQAEPSQWRDMIVVSLVREGIDKHKARELADHFAAQPVQQAEPICPECKAAVLYECVACSSNNYPPQQQAEPVAWDVFELRLYGAPQEKQHRVLWVDRYTYPDGSTPDLDTLLEAAKTEGGIDGRAKTLHVRPLYTTPPQQQAEPVVWGVDWGHNGDRSCVAIIKKHHNGTMEVIATEYDTKASAPPQRPWVGLTDEDVNRESAMIASQMKLAFHAGMYVAQQILKEKNSD